MKFLVAISFILFNLIGAFNPPSTFIGSQIPSISSKVCNNSAGNIEMRGRICQLTGKRPNRKARVVTFSHKRIHKVQQVNLHKKVYFVESLRRNIKIRICAKAMRTIDKLGLEKAAKKYKVDLSKF
mmetsp:Transcript_4672/g.7069  ORF Transcript_4672/g.7069 Transcript_4672/m.7069 type:complete len:126 (-) Transcript_4672:60-437(-)